MPEYKGFDDWIEIFRGGKQRDSMGREHDGDALIDKAVANFNAAKHEPPLVVGHPRDNAPAYGWVESLKADTHDGAKLLLAKFKQVEPAFVDLAKAGRYKKRSTAFYPDGSLRHVGFLGAAPPAVKGLADVAFTDDGGPSFEFGESEWVIARVFRRLREWLIEKEGADTADRIVGDWEINDIKRQADKGSEEEQIAPSYTEQKLNNEELDMPQGAQSFTEFDLATAVAKGKEEAKAELMAEFAEKEKISRAEARRQQSISFCEEGIKSGTILPAWVKNGLPEFMARLDGDEEICFAEGGAKLSPQSWFRNFMEQLPKVVEFKELATRAGDPGGGNAGAKLAALVAAKQKDNQAMSYSAAFAEVQADHPDLAHEYLQELSAGSGV